LCSTWLFGVKPNKKKHKTDKIHHQDNDHYQ